MFFQCTSSAVLFFVQILLANGANMNAARTDDGDTPLSVASRNKHARVVNQLMAEGTEESPNMLQI